MVTEAKAIEAADNTFWLTLEDRSRRLATVNLVPGRTSYGEHLLSFRGCEYRLWDPYRSKLSAVIIKGGLRMPIRIGERVLYLGAASGTTVSHVSDIIGERGCVYCVDFAHRSFRELIEKVSSHRPNVLPILADARFPSNYSSQVGIVDMIYSDVAQPEQAKLLADNADFFLKKGGKIVLMIKARSIDAVKTPSRVFDAELQILRSRNVVVTDSIGLEPYDKDHLAVFGVRN
jgi:fibrillarin-like pre-rRNA processing protein